MTTRYIPVPVRCMLWGRAAGRCEFAGCNKSLSYHPKTKEDVNLAEVAHIIGFSKDGPRGEEELSEELAKDISNLMLLCGECHKAIDTNKERYPVDHLRPMKIGHERRIEIVGSIDAERQSHVLLYGANVGKHNSPLSYDNAARAMLPDRYPAESMPITLGLGNSSFKDNADEFWTIESAQIRNMVEQRIRPRLATGDIKHLSVFGFAPQPLLILLGFYISDIPAAEIFQLHREPQGWHWQADPEDFEFLVHEPAHVAGEVALVLSLSATIVDERITSVLGEDANIWRITIAKPSNDFLRSRAQLKAFRELIRSLMDRIKARHGQNAVLHVFPAVPVAIAVELGRIIMPKADQPLRVYDQNRELGGFVKALDIPGLDHKEAHSHGIKS